MVKVFVNGTFDIIHPGHLKMLQYAKSLGDHLLVALDSDIRVKQLKGESRPINNLYTRMVIMHNLKPVDEVKLFNTDEDLIGIIKAYEPDIMIVGSDYKNKKVIGSEYAKKLVFFDRLKEYSSTKVIEKIQNEYTLCPPNL